MKEYALYKGEDLLSIGTINEIAKERRVKRNTIAYYKTKSYLDRIKKRNDGSYGNATILISLDCEEGLG